GMPRDAEHVTVLELVLHQARGDPTQHLDRLRVAPAARPHDTDLDAGVVLGKLHAQLAGRVRRPANTDMHHAHITRLTQQARYAGARHSHASSDLSLRQVVLIVQGGNLSQELVSLWWEFRRVGLLGCGGHGSNSPLFSSQLVGVFVKLLSISVWRAWIASSSSSPSARSVMVWPWLTPSVSTSMMLLAFLKPGLPSLFCT